jgi:predicted ArsR family transcriptional regulator
MGEDQEARSAADPVEGMVTLQQQARALGDATRHSIFRYVVDAGRPVGIAELTSFLGLNHNAIRQHLAKLVLAKLLVATSVHGGGPGRPRLVYEPHPAVDNRWGVSGPYERLSLLLVETIRSGDPPVEVGARAAQQYREAAPTPSDAVATITQTMERLGFEPTVKKRGRRIDVVLATCPFVSAAVADPDTVCSLHLGLAHGLAEGTEVVVDELVAKDPRRANCRLRLRDEAVG